MDVLRKTVRQDKYEYYNQQLEGFGHNHHQQHAAPAAAASSGTANRRRQRVAVSAEAEEGEDEAFSPPSIPKEPHQLEMMAATVRKCPLFSGLTEQDRKVVIDALEPIHMPFGHVVFQQGEVPEDNHWYVIASGSCEQIRDLAIVVAKFTSGQSFGEIELMYTTPAQVTTKVSSSSGMDAFRLDRKTYRKIVMNVANERRKLYRELLTGVPFAEELSEQQQVVLADALTPIHFVPGDKLIRMGEQNEWMYIIVDGVVEVFGKDGGKVCDLRRGEMVGELEFLNKHSAVAECIAKTHIQACKLHREHFEMCLGPVTHFIKKTLEKPKYSYYKNQRAAHAQ
jgi:CRP-like cAMP-binding protein